MIFPVDEIIAFISRVMTLEPGDIIATGTPAGVGSARQPPLVVAPDDLVEVEIEDVGLLANPVVAPAALRR
jgi:2-keto-4-pentenoate hydratase/2-oxohepta-3-ene-1,7-dioic acid hydratase in catechol pathway